ncbi:MAG TPA: MBL fold metallo-hydrolase [Candidatus Xenobia bacterium]|nr:MBL fold metallo-hydrolase [Candidatus Xenobia bacterium]
MKFGEFEIFVVSDGRFRLDGGAMFGVVPKTLWERRLASDERNRVTLGLNCLLIRAGKETIVVETGTGEKFDAKRQDIFGIDHSVTLLDSLAARGVTPEDVTMVVNTHLHFDHCGWNTRLKDGKAVPTFPRARYFVQRGEYQHALQPTERDRASYLRENIQPMVDSNQWVFPEVDAQLVPGVELVRLPGHTRDMQGVRIRSGGRTAFFFADMVPTTAHLPYPWIMGYDLYPLTTLEQKKKWIPEAVKNEWLCFFAHDPAVPAAVLRQRDESLRAEPMLEPDLVART